MACGQQFVVTSLLPIELFVTAKSADVLGSLRDALKSEHVKHSFLGAEAIELPDKRFLQCAI